MKELYELIPSIKRARDYRLYDYKGNRYLDLYQNNGHALLGHRPVGLTKIIKNTISKGLIYDLPSIYQKRLKKELAKEFNQYKSFYIFNSMEYALKIIYETFNIKPDRISEPLMDKVSQIAYYRPFLPDEVKKELFSNAGILIPILPFSLGGSPVIVCTKNKAENLVEIPVSPFILAGTLKSIYNLKKTVLHQYEININSKYWIKKGIYLIPKLKPDKYKKIFNVFLHNNILISPDHKMPSILPGIASSGEIKKIIGIFNNITDNI